LVTHNPELTRFANRVIYMHDGMIIGDEKTPIGHLARGTRRVYFRRHRLSEEDIVSGVSALMKNVPGGEAVGKRKPRKKAKVKPRKSKVKRRVER
jgi:hypothetical protein